MECTWKAVCDVTETCMVRSYPGFNFTTHCTQVIQSKTCLIRHLCNLFPCVIRHWFSCPSNHFLCVLFKPYNSNTQSIPTHNFSHKVCWSWQVSMYHSISIHQKFSSVSISVVLCVIRYDCFELCIHFVVPYWLLFINQFLCLSIFFIYQAISVCLQRDDCDLIKLLAKSQGEIFCCENTNCLHNKLGIWFHNLLLRDYSCLDFVLEEYIECSLLFHVAHITKYTH